MKNKYDLKVLTNIDAIQTISPMQCIINLVFLLIQNCKKIKNEI